MSNCTFNPDQFVIFACNPAKEFAQRVVTDLNTYYTKGSPYSINLGKLKTTVFPGGEPKIIVMDTVRERNVHIFQSFRQTIYPSVCQDFQELLTVLDALDRAGAAKISVYIPYTPFQRQDRKTKGREPITARLAFDQIKIAGGEKLRRIVTADIHNSSAAGFFKGPVDILNAWPLWKNYILHILKLNPSEIVIVAPDAGAAKIARGFSEELGCRFAMIEKTRPEATEVEVYYLVGEEVVRGKIAIIIDDMAGTGGTLVKGGNLLIQKGALEVYAFVTHGLFNVKNDIPAEHLFFENGIKVITTDSIPEKFPGYHESCRKWLIDAVSMSKYFSDALYCNETAESLGDKMAHYGDQTQENIDIFKQLILTKNHEPVMVPAEV